VVKFSAAAARRDRLRPLPTSSCQEEAGSVTSSSTENEKKLRGNCSDGVGLDRVRSVMNVGSAI
jgi:hypothetical protein